MTFSFSRLLFALFLAPLASCVAQDTNISPTSQMSNALTIHFQRPFCYKTSNKDENSAQKYTHVIQLYKATFKDPQDPESVWDQDYLQHNPHVLQAIYDFKKGLRAQTLKRVNLEGKTALELHKELINLGFLWIKHPLRASFKKQTYWLMNGETTKDPHHKNIVYLHFYIHSDGSLVRLKAAGVPDFRGKHPRRAAHAVKVVLLNVDPNLCQKKNCHYDTSYQNEAFKVTNDNQPVPKAPTPKFGLKIPKNLGGSSMDKQQVRLIQNAVMNLAFTNLKTNCPQPQY